jgi:protein TonB
VVQTIAYAATKPIPGNADFPRPQYPYECKKRRIQGTTTVLMNYDSSGRVVEASVTSSSGNSLLDRAALDGIRKTWFFGHIKPNQSGSAEVPIRFELTAN